MQRHIKLYGFYTVLPHQKQAKKKQQEKLFSVLERNEGSTNQMAAKSSRRAAAPPLPPLDSSTVTPTKPWQSLGRAFVSRVTVFSFCKLVI